MDFDLEGRLDNMLLPDGKTAVMFAIYEAVSNALHAIEERFGNKSAKRGIVDIIVRTEADSEVVAEITIRDNGIGLTPDNLKAFNTCDSRRKKDRGGKGVGRLIWLKLFDEIAVSSRYALPNGGLHEVSFNFVLDQKDSLKGLTNRPIKQAVLGTEIILRTPKPGAMPSLRPSSVLKELTSHFFAAFVDKSMPTLRVAFNDHASTELSEFIKERIVHSESEDVQFALDGNPVFLQITHLYIDRRLAKNLRNSVLLIAHHRLVELIEIGVMLALQQLSDDRAYVCVVRSKFLDERVDQERTSFKLTEDQHRYLKDVIFERARNFLADHISKIQAKQRIVVTSLLDEHPQLALKVGDIKNYVESLAPSMDEEQVGQNLFTLLYRDERKIAREVAAIKDSIDLTADVEERTKRVASQVGEQARVRLAEYVAKRRQILDLAHTYMRHREGESGEFHYEKTVHDLICPMGNFYSQGNYADHNLWIIDDLLAYYQFFGSDKQIRTFSSKDNGRQEPDIIFFNPAGFRRKETSDAVVIVEFKRPGDESPSGAPVEQVLTYIEKLRSHTIRRPDGELVTEVTEQTPFVCYVICDLTISARQQLKRSLANFPTPDGEGFFGFSPEHRAIIHVISYKKMLSDARKRNQVFFEKLGNYILDKSR